MNLGLSHVQPSNQSPGLNCCNLTCLQAHEADGAKRGNTHFGGDALCEA